MIEIADIICPRQYNEALILQHFFPCDQKYIQLDPAMHSRAEHFCLPQTLGGRELRRILFARCFTAQENLNGTGYVFNASGFLNLQGYYVDCQDTALNCWFDTPGRLKSDPGWICSGFYMLISVVHETRKFSWEYCPQVCQSYSWQRSGTRERLARQDRGEAKQVALWVFRRICQS